MKVLFIAYKIEKNKGSEDATAYHIIPHLIQKGCDITLITRQNNIDKLKNDPLYTCVSFIAIELPHFITSVKRTLFGMIIYYLMWQIMVGYHIKKITRIQHYDVIHAFNFHASWCPHFIPRIKDTKIFFGPVTRHKRVPWFFWYGSKSTYIAEIFRSLSKVALHYCNRFLYLSLIKSDRIYVGQKKLFYPYTLFKRKIHFLPQAGSTFPPSDVKPVRDIFNVLYVGRMTNLKGAIIALKSYQHFFENLPDNIKHRTQLTMIGEGNLYPILQNLVAAWSKTHGYDTISIKPWIEQKNLQKFYQDASVFLYPSFEGQGLVVAEALSQSVPIICFSGTGPHDVAGKTAFTVPILSCEKTYNNISLTLKRLSMEYWDNPVSFQRHMLNAYERAQELDWESKATIMMRDYHE